MTIRGHLEKTEAEEKMGKHFSRNSMAPAASETPSQFSANRPKVEWTYVWEEL